MKRTQEEKIKYLEKLLRTYLLFSRHYTDVRLTVNSETIEIKWCGPKKDWIHNFESIEFPITDIDDRILNYKIKVRNSFNNRNK